MNLRAVLASSLVWLVATTCRPTPGAARPAPPENPWATLLRLDVEAMRRVLLENHPGAVDELNKGFAQWLEAGYRQALERAKRCNSFEGYRFALEAYGFGFKDVHLGLWTELRREDVRWPGFMTGWQGEGGKGAGKLVVRVTDEGKAGEGAPAIGSEVISCDGKKPRELLERDVFPFAANPDFEAAWAFAAPMLLVDEANPWRSPLPRSCKILANGVARDHTLQWRPMSYGTLRRNREQARERPNLDFVIRPFGERGVWVGMPSFNRTSETVIAGMRAAIERAASWRDRDPIVFDVRNNGGGSSLWGKEMLEALYGADFLASRVDPLEANEYVEWRVSPGNVEHVKGFFAASPIRAKGGDPGEEARARAALADFARALAEGESLWRQPKEKRRAFAKPPVNPVAGRVFLLTDHGCASACLDFADLVRALPGTQHVGQTTLADSVYMELRHLPLPSGIAELGFATKVYRNRPRGNNQPYVPHHVWQGNIGDTAALERWILSLPPARR